VNIICFFDPCFDEERMIQCARLAGMHEQIMAMTPLSYAIAQIPNRLHRFGNFVTKTGSVGCIVLVHSFFRQRGYSLTASAGAFCSSIKMDRYKVSAVKQLVIRISLIVTDAEQLHSGNPRMLPAGGALCAAS
jgi:hypothetical protein